MLMPGASSGTISITTTGGSATSSSNYAVIANIPPIAQQGSKLVGTGNVGAANQGFSVALSADGNTSIVGGINHNGGVGAAWIYTRIGGNWTQQGSKLIGIGATGVAYQGPSVAISADGNTAIVGGTGDNSGVGAAWVFVRSGSTWSQQGNKLVGTNAIGQSSLGSSVSISANGNTVIIGGFYDNNQVGAAWIFTRTGSTWTQQGSKLVGSGADVNGAEQGQSVAISADGNTVIIGGYLDNNLGAAWIFTRSSNVWSQQGSKLVGTGAVGNASQGMSVSISANGNTAIVGGNYDNNGQGAVWVFTRSGTVWSQQGNKLVGTSGSAFSYQGTSVALSADGNTLIVGGYNDNNSAKGATWLYTRSGATWTQQGNKIVGTGNTGFSYQGYSLSLSADGNTALIGGYNDNSGQGAAWVFNGALSADSNLSALSISAGTLSPSFSSATVSYTASVSNAISSVTVTPTKIDANASIQVRVNNGTYATVNSGSASGALALNVGSNTIDVKVTTQNGSSIKIYTITVTRVLPPPTITSFTPSSASVGSLVTITGANLSNLTAITIGGVSAIIVSNTGTDLVAMVMPGSNTGNIALANSNGNATSSSNFVVTPNIPPAAQQGSKLVGTGVVGFAAQEDVSLSADGNTAIVGGIADDEGNGAVWIYTRSGALWSQQGNKLVGTGNIGAAWQGSSVALSADGNTAIVGGIQDDNGQGAVWIFICTANNWSQQGNKLVGTGGSIDAKQGTSVALSADGSTALVGGIGDSSGRGAVWVFTRNGINWTQQGGKLVGTGSIIYASSYKIHQGQSVALSADGNTVIVGGSGDNGNKGAAWVYTRVGNSWTQQGSKLVGTGAIFYSNQGFSVSLSADGNTAIVGGPIDNYGQGAAWVFVRSGSNWTQQGNKIIGSGYYSNWGCSVSLSADGNTALMGGGRDNNGQGATWLFTRSGNTWTQQGNKIIGSGGYSNAHQGGSVSLSADGNTSIVGGYNDNNGQGAVWVFNGSSTNSQTQLTLTAFLEGSYLGNDSMTAAPFSADGISPMDIADTITIELHQSGGSHSLEYSSTGLLNTTGLTTINFPSSTNGKYYYIVIKHRNSIETWSADSVLLSNTGTTYDFSSFAAQSFGDNMSVDVNIGLHLIYSGDINQDGSIDFNDYPDLDISSNNGDLGYLVTDLNGDASVDFNDYPILDINSNNGIITLKP